MLWRIWAVIWLCTVPFAACAQTPTGPSFDPKPVTIPDSIEHIPARTITSMDLLTLRDITGLSISPNGRMIAFVLQQAVYGTNGYRTGLFLANAKNGATLRTLGSAGLPHWGDINEVSPENPQWSPDGQYLTYRARWDIQSTWQIWRWDIQGGQPVQLTHTPGNVANYEWAPDGKRILLDVQHAPDSSMIRELSEHGILYDGNIYAWQGLPIVQEALANKPSATTLWLHHIDSGMDTKATEEEKREFRPGADVCGAPRNASESGQHQVLDAKRSPNGQFLLCRVLLEDVRESSSQAIRLDLESLASGKSTELTPAAYYVEQYWWSGNSHKIFYTEYEGEGYSDTLFSISPESGKAERLYAGLDYLTRLSTDADGNYAACLRETTVVPPQIAFLDLQTGSLRTVVDVNPEFASLSLTVPRRIEGVNRYGEKWFGHLVTPPNYTPGQHYPLIVTTYRSGEWFLRGASGNENPIQVYAANGFVVLNIDVGKNPNIRPGDFDAALKIWTGPTASIEDAVKQLRASGLIDSRKVGISGYSHGAEIMAYAISHTDIFSAASGDSGARDPYFYYIADKAWHDIFRKWGLGGWPDGQARKRWKVLSPTLDANHISSPLLINAADSEFISDLPLFTSLQELRKPVELYIYADELHVKNQPVHRYEIYERNLDWFKFWLMDETSSDPAKAEQNRRWRQFRPLKSKHSHPRKWSDGKAD